MPPPRAPRGAAEDAARECHLCNTFCTASELKWLCLCTKEVRRAHRNCVFPKGSGQSKVCHQRGMENQYETLQPIREASKVIIIGAGPAGSATALRLTPPAV